MYQYYNVTNITSSGNTTTLLSFAQNVSQAVGYFPGIIILLIMYIVPTLALRMKGYSTIAAFTTSSFVCAFIAMLLFGMGLLAGRYFLIALLICPICIFLLWILE